jgi:hypothetical protein
MANMTREMASIKSRIEKLQAELFRAMEEKSKVEEEAKECLDRLSLAERLTSGQFLRLYDVLLRTIWTTNCFFKAYPLRMNAGYKP